MSVQLLVIVLYFAVTVASGVYEWKSPNLPQPFMV